MTQLHGFTRADLRLLHAVAATGSFTSAAASLHFTQSGVSRRVGQLERAVGGPIFRRLPRGVRPTPLGEVVLAHVEELAQRFEALAGDLEALLAGTGGRLRVGSFPTANSSLTPEALGRFRRERPDVAVRVVEGQSPSLLDGIAGGTLDVAVVSDWPTGPLATGGADLVHLLDDELLIALPAVHPHGDRRRLRLADLADDDWIDAAPEGGDNVVTLAAARAGFERRITLRVASWTAKLRYVAAGFGVTVVPRLLAAPVPAGVVIRPLHDLPRRRVSAALVDDPTPAARALVDHLRAAAAAAATAAADHRPARRV